jgi:nitroreductase
MDDALELIKGRRSDRVTFDPHRPVPTEDVKRILEAARWAPTPHNMQNFEVVVVDDKKVIEELGGIKFRVTEAFLRESYDLLSVSEDELKRKGIGILASGFPPAWTDPSKFREVAETVPPQPLSFVIGGSPLLMMVLFDPRRRAPGSEGDFQGIVSLGTVMESMWLEATSLGISARLVVAFAEPLIEREVKRVIGVPKEMRIAYGLRLGYPAGRKDSSLRVRRDLDAFTHHNSYGSRGV